MINTNDILETIGMIQDESLDIRTITMGISLLDSADSDIDKSCQKIYGKICRKAEKLVSTGESIEKKYDIPIVNVVTDYYFHKSWLTKNAYRYFVSNENSKKAFVEAGVDSDKVKVLGIPINTKFDEKVDKKKWYEKNNLSLDKMTILLSAGAFGVTNNFENTINNIIDVGDLQVVIICGKNNQLKMRLEKNFEGKKDIKIISIQLSYILFQK